MISRGSYVSKNSGRLKKWGRISQQTPCSSTKTKICYNLCLALLVSIFTTSRIQLHVLSKIDLQKKEEQSKSSWLHLRISFQSYSTSRPAPPK